MEFKFQSTPPSREATVIRPIVDLTNVGISIHASLAGGDVVNHNYRRDTNDFNPRLPRGRRPGRKRAGRGRGIYFNPRLPRGRRLSFLTTAWPLVLFQSTPPSREATLNTDATMPFSIISIHASLAGGDDFRGRFMPEGKTISIHASLAGGDGTRCGNISNRSISIHASLAGGDTSRNSTTSGIKFQSTPPSREATVEASGMADRWPISIHASLAGGDVFAMAARCALCNFNPRLPRGRRRLTSRLWAASRPISIHASLAGGDPERGTATPGQGHFNPRLPRGRRQQDIPLFCLWSTIYGNSCEFVVRDAAFPSLLWRKSGEFRLVLVRTDRGNGRSFRFARLGILPMICF